MSISSNARFRSVIIYGLFFVSGCCGLMYQVVWTRLMTHVFGTTLMAVSTVLASFMAGLAIGSYFLGKRADQSESPLRLYAYYEVGIGVAALFVLLALNHLTPFYLWLSDSFGSTSLLFGIGRFLAIFLIILVPTTLMGATLPILSRLVISKFQQAGRGLGSLYAINTVGAVFGCLLAGFYLIAEVGTHNTIYLAAALNLGVGVVSWLLAKAKKPWINVSASEARAPKRAPKQLPQAQYSPFIIRLLLVGFALSGMTSFAYEVFWVRSLVFYVGNSTYAVTTMLTAFLVGIALGGWLARFVVDRSKSPVNLFAWMQIGIGISAAAAMPLLTKIMYSDAFLEWYQQAETTWSSSLSARFVISLLVMLIPTTLIGMTFPLVGKILLKDLRQTGETIGKAYAVNTIGNIVGALAPAFLVIPMFGIHKGIWLMAVINVAVGLTLLAYGQKRLRWPKFAVPMAVTVLFLLVIDLSSSAEFPSDTQMAEDKVLYYREGPSATTKVFVKALNGDKHMSVDGIHIGGSDEEVDYKQQWLAHLPKLLMNNFKTELSIGLGSGILVGESVLHPGMERVTCVEIAPSVVEAAHHFREENGNVMESPKLQMVTNDGVNYLLTSRERYDIISSDAKTEPEHGVNGIFFSREYYILMRDHLTPHGISIQWIPIHYPPRIFKTVIATCVDVFPHVQLWFSNGNCFLVASNHKLTLDAETVNQKLGDAEQPYHGIRKFGITNAKSLFSHLVATEDMLAEHTKGIQLNTLENPIIEFFTSSDFAESNTERKRTNLDFIMKVRGQGDITDQFRDMPDEVHAAYSAMGAYLKGFNDLLAGSPASVIEPQFKEALKLSANCKDIRYHIYEHYYQTTKDLMALGNYERAVYYASKAASLWEDSAELYYEWAISLLQINRVEQAFSKLDLAVQLNPKMVQAQQMLAKYHLMNNRPEAASRYLREIIRQNPKDVMALNNLGSILTDSEKFDEALELLKNAYAIAPENPNIIDSYAWAMFKSGDNQSARAFINEKGFYYKDSAYLEKRREIMLEN